MLDTLRLQVVVAHRPPFVFVGRSGNTTLFSGMLVDLLDRIFTASNATARSYDLYVSPSNAGGTLSSSGNWSGARRSGNREAAAPLRPGLACSALPVQ
jgi:hypothetical protein